MNQLQTSIDGKTLVFLVGAPRSGTTWLQLLLARSPEVATAQETHIFSLFLRSMIDEWNRLEKTGERIGLSQLLSRSEFRGLLRNISGYLFAKIAEKKPAARVILDKTPNHVYCWREILDIWPDAHFIHIIRDPRSVVASMRVASRTWASHWASPKVSKNCERWISDVSNGLDIRSATGKYQQVFFRDLASDGPNVVRRLLAGIGVQSSEAECQRYVEECNIDFLRSGTLADAPFDISKMNKESFRLGTVDGWRTELSKYEIAVIEHMAGPLMMKLEFRPAAQGKLLKALLELRGPVRDTRAR
jgi:hypothetical protein